MKLEGLEATDVEWNFEMEEVSLYVDVASIRCFIGAKCSSVVRTFAHDAMDCRIDPSGSGPIELFLVPASAPRLV